MVRLVYWIIPAVSSVLCARIALLYFQQESNQFPGYLRSLRRNWLRAFLPGILVSAVGCVAVSVLTADAFDDWRLMLGAAALLVAAVIAYFAQRRLPAKKPLVFTARIKRLVVALLVISLGVSALVVYAARVLTVPLLLPVLTPVLLALAALIMLPVELWINHLYLRDAMKRLDAMPELIKIGITGSYGKTSAKFMLYTILSEKFRVLATPGSFNTSMGVTRVVREQLAPDHQVFIAEMGARYRGDIALLCKLVRPKYGMITSVGPQHLETFKSQENVCKEKFVLAQSLPADGDAVFAADGRLCEALYEKKIRARKHLAGGRTEGLGLRAENVEVGPWGSRFLLSDGENAVPCQTRLLGALNISNLLLACTMARVLGMDLETIARGVSKVQPVEHRLELLRTSGPYMVIDDAYNANPIGARAALDVLKSFPGRGIIITPGFVELGSEEARLNREFGEYMAGRADVVILVGRRHTEPVAEGLRSQGFDEDNLHIVGSLDEAVVLLAEIRQPGDVELYENDLPDNYQE